jgi:hypothetical protein
MSGHTPGPWRFNPDFMEVQSTDANYLILADLPSGLPDTHPAVEIAVANGILMAEAPNLLVALELAREWLNRLCDTSEAAEYLGASEDIHIIGTAIERAKRVEP